MWRSQQLVLNFFLAVVLVVIGHFNSGSLVWGQNIVNGGFEQDADNDGLPDEWVTAGRSSIRQTLTRVLEPGRGYVACLKCTHFEGGFPDSHVMLAQLNRVGVTRGQWYRLRLWARAEDLEFGAVSISLVNRKIWQDVGLRETFSPRADWKPYEFHFRATRDLAPEDSRFQIYFQGTGTLFLDDIVLEPVSGFRPQRLPQLPTKGLKNLLVDSSFECGASDWGTVALGITSWAGNLFHRVGTWDSTKAYHGTHSWRISLSQSHPLISYFDYFDPVATVVRSVVIANKGWIPLEKGNRYVLSAYVCADQTDVPVVLLVRQETRTIQQSFRVGPQWTRFSLSFVAEYDFAYCGVGIDLQHSPLAEATIWVDAVQFERVDDVNAGPSDYRPARSVESAISTDRMGNIFLTPERGFDITLRAFNGSTDPQCLEGNLRILDYKDRPIWQKDVRLDIPQQSMAEERFSQLLAGRRGFFRVTWEPQGAPPQSLRIANIDPIIEQDTAFGMNHAFSWDFLLELSHAAGLRWWRDWSCQWRLVQKTEGGPFDFQIPDTQIKRVLQAGGNPLVLLPFPATEWSAIVDTDRVAREAGSNSYLQRRLIVAQKPRDVVEFGQYVRATVEHYHKSVKVIEILNEPLFTSYALPNSFGWNISDYLDILKTAYESAKAVDPECLVIGGIAAPPESNWVRQFIEQGGLQWCDVMNLHLYPHRGSPDAYESSFAACHRLMEARGQVRPIWVTEIGCYADDDPPTLPFSVGDEAMNRSLRPSEYRAAIDLVKFAAVMGAAGVKKVFYHAGTCGALNENTAGNIFFEYGGEPRKMYAAQAVLSDFLGADWNFVGKWGQDQMLQGFRFQSKGREVIVLWSRVPTTVSVPQGYQVWDIMGNPSDLSLQEVTDEPVYLIRHIPNQN
ncbi:MAG TPA: glycosyl hydrolase [Thermogutta sp.]|nr:glycosyl hydrolase [Thermogutta sp.]